MTTNQKHPEIIMHGVQSSQIKEIGFDQATNTLAVRFNAKNGPGSLYHYSGVDAETFEKFKSAESIGAHFGKHIKGAFGFQKINEKKEDE